MIKMYLFLAGLRKNIPSNFAETEVISVTDYEKDNSGLPKSNVLLLNYRTEPKLYATFGNRTETENIYRK